MKAIVTIEHGNISSMDNLFYQHKGGVVCLNDDVNGEIGWFEVFYDAEEDGREYITLNNEIVYLDNLSEL